MSGTERTTMDPSTFDRVWRGSGVAFVVTFVASWLIHGSQPGIGASADTLVSFYDGDRTRILMGRRYSHCRSSICCGSALPWRPPYATPGKASGAQRRRRRARHW